MTDPLTRAAPSAARFTADGHVRIKGGLDPAACAALGHRWSELRASGAGTRRALRLPWCRALADRLRAHASVAALIPHDFVALQCTAFAKRGDDARADANWLVPLHQDLSIPVQHRLPDAALTGWSQKERVWFVQPSVEFLAQLVAVRLHVDACGPDDGPLRVVPGSHAHGRLDPAAAQELRARAVSCTSCSRHRCRRADSSGRAKRDHGRGHGGNRVESDTNSRGSLRRRNVRAVCLRPRRRPLARRARLARPRPRRPRGGAGTSSPRRVLHFLFAPPVPPYGLEWPREA
ncbi:MAG: phytanoyl-CoA dioxygenase family protein [Planctomycetota bacterium]